MYNAKGTLYISHKNCCDGAACMAIFKELGKPKDIDITQFHQYGETDAELMCAVDYVDNIVMGDFTYPEHLMRKMLSAGKTVTVYDHHISAKETLMKLGEEFPNLNYFFDVNKCGAEIVADNLLEPTSINYHRLPLTLVGDRDLFLFGHTQTSAFNEYLRHNLRGDSSRAMTERLYFWLFEQDQFGVDNIASFLEPYQTLVDKKQAECDEYAQPKYWAPRVITNKTTGQQIPVVVRNLMIPYQSDVGAMVALREGCVVLMYTIINDPTKGQIALVALRSKGDVDCSSLAKSYGGGGHKNASGFSFSLGELVTLLS
jgi:oligoribonuclease NrnB/cAMP/cGMP phosphodiesterase (DHH superfamily)